MTRFATFNLENLFTRPVAMSRENDATGKEVLRDFAELNSIVIEANYSADDKNRLVQLSLKYGFHLANQNDPFIRLNKIRGQLFRLSDATGVLSVVANGKNDWTGWFHLLREDVSWEATYNTGRVVNTVNPDVLICIEVEDRITLDRFNGQVLRKQFGDAAAYPHVLLLDGNDARGIDIGILSRFEVTSIRSHLHEADPVTGEKLFSRDCPEFEVTLGGKTIIVLGNHFKSKRSGNSPASTAKRTRQASRTNEIYAAALQRSDLVIIGGDLNDTPTSEPIIAITQGLTAAKKPKDVMTSPLYTDPYPGTYGTGLASGKFDYLFLSPSLWTGLGAVGIERRGTYHPQKWDCFDTVTGEVNQASDHACLWADIAL